jgi:hypothetical protein
VATGLCFLLSALIPSRALIIDLDLGAMTVSLTGSNISLNVTFLGLALGIFGLVGVIKIVFTLLLMPPQLLLES